MKDLSDKSFGLLIAYVLPGFVALWGVQPLSDTVEAWLYPSPTIPAGLESLFFVGLASVTAGLSVSALRWALIDTFHHCTGLARPEWDDTNLPDRLAAFDTVVEAHYRYYQFYSNMAVVLPLAVTVHVLSGNIPGGWLIAAAFGVELLFVATSRDTLRKYYARTAKLLGSLPRASRRVDMCNGNHPRETSQPTKPSPPEEKKPKDSGK